MVQTGMPFFER